MKTSTDYIDEIVSRILELDPHKIVLFGSQATGTHTEDSDIDLLVILDSDRVSSNYEEKMKNRLAVRNIIYEINKHVPIDLLVYTKAEYAIIEEASTSFINELNKTGKILYEKAN